MGWLVGDCGCGCGCGGGGGGGGGLGRDLNFWFLSWDLKLKGKMDFVCSVEVGFVSGVLIWGLGILGVVPAS
jgi:hypothetical protein